MSQHSMIVAHSQQNAAHLSLTPVPHGTLQRCSNGVECEECRKKREGTLQRAAVNTALVSDVQPVVHEVLNTPGQPLDASTRNFMEPRFGHDFSRVRVHSDVKAAESARAVNALAYTVGHDVVFSAGQYAPGTMLGKQLLVHELTHVVQQGMMPDASTSFSFDRAEMEAQYNSQHLAAGASSRVNMSAKTGIIQRQEHPNPLDDAAKSIIDKVKNEEIDIKSRAVTLVNDIINSYYQSSKSKVKEVAFDDAKAGNGLLTHRVGKGPMAQGIIYVGNYFIQNIDRFAHRVLQVGHELQHIEQFRGGMVGGSYAEKREFLSFYWEALEPEKGGTGSLNFATRLSVIDAALGSLNCLSEEDKTSFTEEKKKLLKRRDEVNGKAGNPPIPTPTACVPKANRRSKQE